MKIIRNYWHEFRFPRSLRTQREQQEFVLRRILIAALLVLSLASILLLLGGVLGASVSMRLWDIAATYLVFLIGLYLVSQGKINFVRKILVLSMFLMGMWHTVFDGFGGIDFYFFVIAIFLSFMLWERRRFVISLFIVAPIVVDLLLRWDSNYVIGVVIKYLGFSIGLSLLLMVYNQILEIFRSERMLVNEVEKVQRAGASVISTLDLQETIARILDQLTIIIPHDSACVLLLQEDGDLEIVGGRGWENPRDVIGIRFEIPGDNPNSVVMETGKPYILGNAPEQYQEFLEEPHNHILSWLGIPLIRDENIIGMMAIDSAQPNYFSEEHIRLLSSFADYVSIAIENALLYEVAHQSVNRRAILHKASQDVIKASADLEEIYQAVYTAALRLMPCDAFAITLMRNDVYEGVFLVEAGTRIEDVILPFETSLSKLVVGEGKSILIENIDEEPLQQYYEFTKDGQVRSLVAVPLKVRDEVMGVLTAQSYTLYSYSEEDLKLLEMLGANAAIAIKNAELLAEVAHLARTDSLTGLLNRRAFEEELASEILNAARYNYPIGLLMIDIDDFKQFNDSFGHNRGDEHLQRIAEVIRNCVRLSDTVARIGGEEFTVILPHTGQKGAVQLAERIREAVFKEFEDADYQGRTVSVGVAIYPNVAGSLKDLYISADKAMFKAKGEGKNRVVALTTEVLEQ